MLMEAFSNTRSAYEFEKLRQEGMVVEGVSFRDTCGGQEILVPWWRSHSSRWR
jgi:hypothetical protein